MTDPAAPVCIAGDRPHPATDGQLCRNHFEELGKWLREVEDELDRLSAVPSMATWGVGGGSSVAAHLSPVVLDAIVYNDRRSSAHGHRTIGPLCASWRCGHGSCSVIRSDRDEDEANADRLMSALDVLHGWADQVREGRELTPPRRPVVERSPADAIPGRRWWWWVPDVTIASERDVLTRQLNWIAWQPWLPDFRDELGALRRHLLRLNRNDDRPDPLPGWCPRLTADGHECQGSLWPARPVHTSASDGYADAEGVRAVVCDGAERHRYEDRDLARLRVMIAGQRRKDTA